MVGKEDAMSSRLIGVGLIALLTAGCAVPVSGGRIHFFPQRGIVLALVHTCTDRAIVYNGGLPVAEVIGATPTRIGLDPAVYGDSRIEVVVQSMSADGKVFATHTASFDIDYQSTTTRTWIIGNSNTWSGSAYHTSCR